MSWPSFPRRLTTVAKAITFTHLEQFLRGLGFQVNAVPKSHVAFEHSPTGALILLRPYRAEEDVSPRDLALVRRVLDENGIVDRERFDSLLNERALAG
jgi:hypothetical protein